MTRRARGFPFREALVAVRPELAAKRIGEGTEPRLLGPGAAPQEQGATRGATPLPRPKTLEAFAEYGHESRGSAPAERL